MTERTEKNIYIVSIVFPTRELEVTVYSDVAKAIINGFLSDQGSIRFVSINEGFYALDYTNVLYIRAKPWVVELS